MDLETVKEDLSTVKYAGYFLASFTGVIHLYLAFRVGVTDPLGAGFLVAGIGFFLGIGLVRADFHVKHVYLLGIPFTAGQIAAWYYMNNPSLEAFMRGEPVIDFTDKTSQALLLGVLAYLYSKERK